MRYARENSSVAVCLRNLLSRNPAKDLQGGEARKSHLVSFLTSLGIQGTTYGGK